MLVGTQWMLDNQPIGTTLRAPNVDNHVMHSLTRFDSRSRCGE